MADFDRDGTSDLAVVKAKENLLSILSGDGAGGFTSRLDVPVGVGRYALAVADLNGDRYPDVVVANADANTISVLTNTGGRTSTTSSSTSTSTTPPSSSTTSSSTTSSSIPTTAALTAPFVSSFTPTNVRNDFSGWVGSTVRVGAKDLQVSALGRAVVAGNSATHTVKLVDAATGNDVAGASATVATAGAQAGSFRYANLASPVTVRANATYYRVTQETAGGDTWYDYDTRLVTTSADRRHRRGLRLRGHRQLGLGGQPQQRLRPGQLPLQLVVCGGVTQRS